MAAHLPGTILVIDDEPSVLRALTRLLGRDGYRIGTARNGRDALTQLQAQAYDVIVCDLRMPELDGPAFYAILTRQYPALRQRVIFLTGDAGSEASRTFLTQSGRPWLRKPSAITTIRRAIQQVLQAFPQAEAEHARSQDGLQGGAGVACPSLPRDGRGRGMVYSPTMKITSTTDLEFPGLKFAIRQGEVKDLPDDPEAAAFILASVYIREVPEPQSETTREAS